MWHIGEHIVNIRQIRYIKVDGLTIHVFITGGYDFIHTYADKDLMNNSLMPLNLLAR